MERVKTQSTKRLEIFFWSVVGNTVLTFKDNRAYFSKMQKSDSKCGGRTKGRLSSSCHCAVRKAAWLRTLAQEPVSLMAIHYHLKRGVPWMKLGSWHSSASYSHERMRLSHCVWSVALPTLGEATLKSGHICFHLGYMISEGLIWTNPPLQPQTVLFLWDL